MIILSVYSNTESEMEIVGTKRDRAHEMNDLDPLGLL